jgi:hypothetical protein
VARKQRAEQWAEQRRQREEEERRQRAMVITEFDAGDPRRLFEPFSYFFFFTKAPMNRDHHQNSHNHGRDILKTRIFWKNSYFLDGI